MRDVVATDPCPRRSRDQSGSASVELALLVPALVIMLGLLVGGGRLWLVRTAVNEAAQSAARSASLARNAQQASTDAVAAGSESLSTTELSCGAQSITVDTDAFAVAVGQPATITSNVSCTVPFADVFLPGMPGSIKVQGKGLSALDTYRSRR